MRERLLRAASAVVAGLWTAWEHLTDSAAEPVVQRVPMSLHPCPLCGASLVDGPHIHDEDVIWSTEHPGAVLLTDLRGADPLVIPETEE